MAKKKVVTNMAMKIGYIQEIDLQLNPQYKERFRFKEASFTRRISSRGDRVYSKMLAYPVDKEWIALLKKNNLKVKSRPQPGFYFGIWGKGSSRLFEHDGKLYMSLNYNQDFEDPQDCEPILGSEFYKVLEELEHNKKK